MKKGDIVFIKSNSVIADIITRVDKMSNGKRGKFSHVAIAISDKHVVEANYDKKVSIVNLENQMSNINRIEVIDLKLTQEEREIVYNSTSKYMGDKYDYAQIFSLLINKLFKMKRYNDRHRFICSELVVTALIDSGLLDKYKDCESLYTMTPNELYEFIKSTFI